MNKDEILSAIEKMNMLEVSELVHALEEKFGVSAAMPIAAGASPAQTGETEASSAQEKTLFTVELADGGAQKIQVIKALREVTSLGLKEAKDLVDGAPKVVKENATKEEAETIKKKIEDAGGKVTLK